MDNTKKKKKKPFLFWLLKLLLLVGILLFFLWQFSKGGEFWSFQNGSSQQAFQQDPAVEPSKSPSAGEAFLVITITEDKIYLDNTLISLEDLKGSLSELSIDQKLKLEDDKALYKLFNEVKMLLDEGSFVYILE